MSGTQTPEPSSQKVKLKLSGRTDDSASGRYNDGIGVDSESLRRQQALVHAGTNGSEGSNQSTNTPSRSLRDRSGSGARSSSRRTQDRDVQQPANDLSPMAEPSAVKPETSSRQTPNVETTGGQSQVNGAATRPESNLLKGAAEYVNSHDAGSPEQASDAGNTSQQDGAAPHQKVRRAPRGMLVHLVGSLIVERHALTFLLRCPPCLDPQRQHHDQPCPAPPPTFSPGHPPVHHYASPIRNNQPTANPPHPLHPSHLRSKLPPTPNPTQRIRRDAENPPILCCTCSSAGRHDAAVRRASRCRDNQDRRGNDRGPSSWFGAPITPSWFGCRV